MKTVKYDLLCLNQPNRLFFDFAIPKITVIQLQYYNHPPNTDRIEAEGHKLKLTKPPICLLR